MDRSNPPAFSFYLILSILLVGLGWGGLAAVILLTVPTLGPRWLFFFLGVLGATGTVLPVVYFFNCRFPSNPPVDTGVILRQAIWFGVYACAAAWLQMGRMLTGTVAGIIALVIIIIEVLLRMRERARWQPKGSADS